MVVMQSPVRVTLSPAELGMNSTLTTPPLLDAWNPVRGDDETAILLFTEKLRRKKNNGVIIITA